MLELLERRPQVKSSPVKGFAGLTRCAGAIGQARCLITVRLFRAVLSRAPAARVSDARRMLVQYPLITDTVSIFTPAPATNRSAGGFVSILGSVRCFTMVTVRRNIVQQRRQRAISPAPLVFMIFFGNPYTAQYANKRAAD